MLHARDPEDALRILRFLAQQAGDLEQRMLRRYDRKPKRIASRNSSVDNTRRRMVSPAGVKLLQGGILPSCVVESKNIGKKTMEMFPGISMDPDIRFGKPCITGTRIDVATLVGAIAAGETVETVADEYALTVEQVRSALSYAAHVAAHLPPAVRQAS